MSWKDKHGKTLREEMGMTLKKKILTLALTNIVIVAILTIGVIYTEKRAATLLIIITSIALGFFNILAIFVAKTLDKIYPIEVQATFLEKGKYTEWSGYDAYTVKYAAFVLPDGTRCTLRVPRKKACNSLHENDTGYLTYIETPMYGGYKLIKFECAGEKTPEQSKSQ